jgi:hypothetical protein
MMPSCTCRALGTVTAGDVAALVGVDDGVLPDPQQGVQAAKR